VVFVGADLRDPRTGVVAEVQRLRLREADHLDTGDAPEQLDRERRWPSRTTCSPRWPCTTALIGTSFFQGIASPSESIFSIRNAREAVALELDADLREDDVVELHLAGGAPLDRALRLIGGHALHRRSTTPRAASLRPLLLYGLPQQNC